MNVDKFLVRNNESKLIALEKSLNSEQAVLFIGAGCSNGVGFPSYSDLLEELNIKLCSSAVPKSDPLSFAKDIKDYIKEKKNGDLTEYYSFMGVRFRKPSIPTTRKLAVHGDRDIESEWPDSVFFKTIFQIPFKAFVTTNYDHSIEEYARLYGDLAIRGCLHHQKGEVGEFLFNLHMPGFYRGVLHLHGGYEEPDKIILCSDDYLIAYKQVDANGYESIHRKTMWALFATRPVIFAGFSLEDKHFMEILSSVCADTWSKFNTRHFALLPFEPFTEGSPQYEQRKVLQREIEEQHGIQVIYYDPSGGHIQLCELLTIKMGTVQVSKQDMSEGKYAAVKEVKNISQGETNDSIEYAMRIYQKARK